MFGEKREYLVPENVSGQRLDVVLAAMENEVSRQYFQKLIKEQRVFLKNRYLKPSYKVNAGDLLVVDFPAPIKLNLEPVAIPLKVVYEDSDVLVIDKQPGLVVHPAEHGKFMGKSLVNAALAHAGESLRGIGGVLRPGIVHRLDKDTSGLIIIAKTEMAHQGLVQQFKERTIDKHYMALLVGEIELEQGRIEVEIGRDFRDRKKMAINGINAKKAITEFKVLKRIQTDFGKFTLVDVDLLTGRTHQIRVHFSSIGYPLAGDKTYGRAKMNELLLNKTSLDRQFLHAYQMKFKHPVNKKELNLKIDLAPDLLNCLKKLEA